MGTNEQIPDGLFRIPVDAELLGPAYDRLSKNEWGQLEAALGAKLGPSTKKYMEGVFQGAHFRRSTAEKQRRLASILKDMKAIEKAVIILLDAVSYPGRLTLGDADALLDIPPDLPLPGNPIGVRSRTWRALIGAARTADIETLETVSAIESPNRFLQDVWVWGYVAMVQLNMARSRILPYQSHASLPTTHRSAHRRWSLDQPKVGPIVITNVMRMTDVLRPATRSDSSS